MVMVFLSSLDFGLPAGPTARGAATSWRVYRTWVVLTAWVRPLAGFCLDLLGFFAGLPEAGLLFLWDLEGL
jgi:hypothetical protein